MKNGISRRTVLGASLAAPFVLRGGLARAADKELRVMAWQGYADDDWVKEFNETSGATAKVVFVGTDDEIWAKIKGSEGKDFDVFAVNTAQLQRYIDAGLVSPLDLAKIPNQQQLLPRFQDPSKVKGIQRDGKTYAVPFAFDAIGIIYDKDKVPAAPDSMEIFWDEKYKGKILAYDNGEHNFSFTALTLGIEDPFHLSADQMAKIKDKLIALKHNVLSFYTTPDEALQLYKDNDVALIWANYGQQQVKAMKDAGANIGYVNAKEGALAWLDTWVMTSGVRDPDLAAQWINFIEQKKIGQQLTERTGFGNSSVETGAAGANDKLVWLEFVEDPTKRSDLWNEIKATP